MTPTPASPAETVERRVDLLVAFLRNRAEDARRTATQSYFEDSFEKAADLLIALRAQLAEADAKSQQLMADVEADAGALEASEASRAAMREDLDAAMIVLAHVQGRVGTQLGKIIEAMTNKYSISAGAQPGEEK